MSEELKKDKFQSKDQKPELELPDLSGARWYDEPREKIFKRLKSDPEYGITDADAKYRLEFYNKNKYFKTERMSVPKYLQSAKPEPLSWLLLGVALIFGIFGHPLEGAAVAIIAVFGYCILLLTGLRALRVLESSSDTSLPTVAVIRGGRRLVISQEEVVPGDVFELETGDLVPADARLIESEGLVTFEYGVTDAFGDVYKDASFASFRNLKPGACRNLVFASTIVKSGKGRAIAFATGQSTRMSYICKNKNPSAYSSMELFKRMRAGTLVSTLIGIASVFVLGIFTYVGIFSKDDPIYGMLTVLCLFGTALSQFYPVIAQIVVARGIFGANSSASNEGTDSGSIIRHPEKLDKIRSLDTLIIPKSALVRQRDTRLAAIFDSGMLYEVGGSETHESVNRLIRLGVVSTGLYGVGLVSPDDSSVKSPGFAKEAILRAAERLGLYDNELDKSFPILDHRDADEVCIFDTTLYSGTGQFVAVCSGEAELVMSRCSYCFENGRYVTMSDGVRKRLETVARRLMRQSFNVIAVATTVSRYNHIKRIDELHSSMVFEGFLCLEEPLLKDASKMLKNCRDAGIRVILAFKDRSEQNYQFAQAQGFVTSREQMGDLEAIYGETADATQFSVLENANAEYLQSTVAYLKRKGHRVGYLGLELDEVPAMQSADVSFTQCDVLSRRRLNRSASLERHTGLGSWDALRFVCDVVVSKVGHDERGGFNAVVGSIMHAKTIFACMDRVLSYLTVFSVIKLLSLIVTLAVGIPMVGALQLVLLAVLIDLPMVMVMAFDPPSKGILKEEIREKELMRSLSEMIKPIFNALAIFALTVCSVMIFMSLGMLTGAEITSFCYLAIASAAWAYLISSSSTRSVLSSGLGFSNMFVLTFVMQALSVAIMLIIEPFGRFFGVSRIHPVFAAVFVGIFVVSLGIFELFKAIITKDLFHLKRHFEELSKKSDKSDGRMAVADLETDTESDLGSDNEELTDAVEPAQEGGESNEDVNDDVNEGDADAEPEGEEYVFDGAGFRKVEKTSDKE